jgi:hypothetical protein
MNSNLNSNRTKQNRKSNRKRKGGYLPGQATAAQHEPTRTAQSTNQEQPTKPARYPFVQNIGEELVLILSECMDDSTTP